MSKLILTGAKRFIDMPKGTIYFEFWTDRIKCENIIKTFESNPKDLLCEFEDMHIYVNNDGSATFYNNEEDEDSPIFYYDANIVGDASPTETLYLVFNEDIIPEKVEINGRDNKIVLTKQQILNYKDKFLKELDIEVSDTNKWARDLLHNDKGYRDDYIINYYKEIEIDDIF